MSDVIEDFYEVGLQIYDTNWRCCTMDYDSELCLVLLFIFLVHLYTRGLPDSFEHLMCATLISFGMCT